MGIMPPTVHLGLLPPDYLKPFQAGRLTVSDKSSTPDGCAAIAVGSGLDPAKIDDAVFGELRVEDDVAHAALAAIIDLWSALDRYGGRRLAAARPQQQPPALLRDQGLVASRQEGHRPWLVELRNLLHLKW